MIIEMRKEGGEKKRKQEETENKGKEKGYQMASASLFFIAAKVAGTFLETAAATEQSLTMLLNEEVKSSHLF